MTQTRDHRRNRKNSRLAAVVPLALSLLIACSAGCASLTNPVANGIPARLLPPELLAPSKEELVEVPLRSLQQRPPAVYRLGPGDILSVYVESVLGEEGQVPPINLPDVESNLQPSVGFPIPVLEDGTVPLPLLDPLPVAGMSVTEARQAIFDAYLEKEIILPAEQVVLVTLIRPRQIRVLVIREDAPGSGGVRVGGASPRGFSGNQIQSGRPRGTGDVVELPAYQNDILTVLAKTGGLPGSDAANEIIVQRAQSRTESDTAPPPLELSLDPSDMAQATTKNELRIPLRLPPGQPLPFDADDVILHEGDIVFVKAGLLEAFYGGGLLPAVQVPLPRDEDLDVLEAISMIGGPILNGGVNSNNLSGGIIGAGVGNPSPSLLTVLRKTPSGQQVAIRVDLNRALVDPRERILVQASDFLILQETPSQALARYTTNAFQLNFLGTLFSRRDAVGTAAVAVP